MTSPRALLDGGYPFSLLAEHMPSAHTGAASARSVLVYKLIAMPE